MEKKNLFKEACGIGADLVDAIEFELNRRHEEGINEVTFDKPKKILVTNVEFTAAKMVNAVAIDTDSWEVITDEGERYNVDEVTINSRADIYYWLGLTR